jgi:hypothetical protein
MKVQVRETRNVTHYGGKEEGRRSSRDSTPPEVWRVLSPLSLRILRVPSS